MLWKTSIQPAHSCICAGRSNPYSRLKIGFALCILFLLQLGALATQMVPLAIEELSAKAKIILQGTVVSKTVQRDSEGRIFTKIELDVADVWKGSVPTNHYSIIQGGGVLGDEQSVVSGEAEYEIGEEIVAFLVLNQRDEGICLGLAQGKFHIWKDALTGETLARNIFHGDTESDNTGLKTGGKQIKKTAKKLTIEELKLRAKGAK